MSHRRPALRDLDVYGSDKGTSHSYIDVYEELLGPIRDSAERVMEIGVDRGGSVRMWHEYFDKAEVVGVDVVKHPDVDRLFEGRKGISFLLADAYDDRVPRKIMEEFGYFDVIVDDGPHTFASLKFAAREYSKLLKPGGLLVLEDVQSPTWIDPLCRSFPDPSNARVFDLRRNKGRWDDILICYKKTS